MASAFTKIPKAPDTTLDYTVDWTQWLEADTITGSTWTVPTGITQNSANSTTTTATIWLSGGTLGTNYTLTNQITTSDGRTQDHSFIIACQAL